MIKDYLRDPSEVLLVSLNLQLNKVVSLKFLCFLREWREINNNICVYNDSLYVFGGNTNYTVECVRGLTSKTTQFEAEAVTFAGPQ